LPITKSELVKQLSKTYPNLLKKDLEKFFDIFINEIKLALKNDERVEMIEECTSDLDNVSAYSNPNNLVVKFAQDKGAIAIIRGLRHVSDFELEFQMANVNHGINSEVSTILMVSNEKFLHLNSSIIRELAEYNTDLSKFVPKNVEERLMKKLKGL